MLNEKKYLRKIKKIGGNSESYRTTIPKEIIDLFEITNNHLLEWKINFKHQSISINIINPNENKQKKAITSISDDAKTEKKTL